MRIPVCQIFFKLRISCLALFVLVSSTILSVVAAMPPIYAPILAKPKRHLAIRAAEHMGTSARTGIKLKSPALSSVRDHSLASNHAMDFSNFSVICSARSDYDLSVYEGLFIAREKPVLNTVEQAGDIRLFR